MDMPRYQFIFPCFIFGISLKNYLKISFKEFSPNDDLRSKLVEINY